MEKIMAVVDENNKVKNIIIGDENSPTEVGTYLVEVKINEFCARGFTWDGTNFLDPSGNPVFYQEEVI